MRNVHWTELSLGDWIRNNCAHCTGILTDVGFEVS